MMLPHWRFSLYRWGTTFNDTAAAFFSRLGTNLLGKGMITEHAWGGFVEALVFYEPAGTVAEVTQLPTAKFFDYINVGVFRGRWDAPEAAQNFLSFKVNHRPTSAQPCHASITPIRAFIQPLPHSSTISIPCRHHQNILSRSP